MQTHQLIYDPTRLTVLARIARTAEATRAGANDALHDAREIRRDLKTRIGQTQMRGQSLGSQALPSAQAEVARLEAELEIVVADISVREVEADEAASAAGSARANLTAALRLANEAGIAIPSSLTSEADRV